MAYYRFSLDDSIVEDPLGWDKFEIGYQRAIDTRGAVVKKPDGDLTFYGEAYNILWTAYQDDGLCAVLDFLVEYRETTLDAWADLYEGKIKMLDLTFLEYNRQANVAMIHDGSYLTDVNSNSQLDAQLDVGRSKNDVSITAAPTIPVDFFVMSTGAYSYVNYPCYRVYDAFAFLVDFLSDGALTFDSTLFGAGGDFEDLAIVTGLTLRTGTASPLTTNFETLLKETWARLNTCVIVDDSGAVPEIRVESTDDSFLDQVGTPLYTEAETGNDLRLRFVPWSASNLVFNGDKPLGMFSKLIIGSEDTIDTGTYPNLRWRGWDKEEYNLTGACAYKQTLEITGGFIVDANIIEAVLAGSTDYDDDIFMVEVDAGGGYNASQYNDLTPGSAPYYYNRGLTNAYIAPRFGGLIPMDVAAYLGDGNDGFEADQSTNINSLNGDIVLQAVPYDNEISDPNLNYDPATYRYTAPSNGLYIFEADVNILNVVIPALVASIEIDLHVKRYDSGGIFLGDIYTESASLTTTADVNIAITNAQFYLDATDYVQVEIEATDNRPGAPHASYTVSGTNRGVFKTAVVENSGGIYQTYDSRSFRGGYIAVTIPMSYAEFEALVAYPRRNEAVFINRGGFPNDITGWIMKASYQLGSEQGLAKLELIVNRF